MFPRHFFVGEHMRIVLATFGSRGDVQPFIVLGQALVRAGHEVVLCAPEDFGGFATGQGLSFQALDGSFEEWFRDSAQGVGKLQENMRRSLARRLEVLPKVVEGADLLVATGLLVEGRSVAEALGVPYRFAAFCPRMQRSRYHGSPSLPMSHSPAWVNHLSWWFNSLSWNKFTAGPINAWRAKAGLAPSRDVFHEAVTESTLLAADPLLAPLPPDLVEKTVQTGAWMMDDPKPLPDEVEAFLAAGEPPVYIGFGSMLDEDPARTTREVLEAVRAAGVRALVSKGWARLGGESLPPGVLAIGAVSHGTLLPRVRAMVHHGGAGTTHAAARAGVAQVVVPHFLDQFYWADRMMELGVAPKPLKRSRLTAPRLAEALRWCLRPESHQRAREVASRMRTDGVEQAVALLTKEAPPVKTDTRLRHGA
jgi:vancomycin aglycone glucosyltransferase